MNEPITFQDINIAAALNSHQEYTGVSTAATIKENEEANRAKLNNLNFELFMAQKKLVLKFIMWCFSIESILIFFIFFFQGFTVTILKHCFFMDEWSFRLLTTCTITQLSIMLTLVVKYLFNTNK